MNIKFGEVWKPVGPFRTPTFKFNTKPLMVGQARRGGLGRRAPPLANTHAEVEVEQHEGSDEEKARILLGKQFGGPGGSVRSSRKFLPLSKK